MLKSRLDNSGFTMLELFIVLTMLAIIITVAAPNFSGFLQEGRIKSGARAVAVSIQTARLKAISGNRRCYLDFAPGSLTPADSFYTLWLDSNGNHSYDSGESDSTRLALPETRSGFSGFILPPGVCFGVSGSSPPTTGPDAGAIPADGVDFGGGDMTWFNSRGEGTAGAVFLTSENGSNYAVTVTNLGAVRTWRWEDNQWK
jgi:prepilin-type N-terminal cleavage/methylation domain-containing protein